MKTKALLTIIFTTALFITFTTILIITAVIDNSDEAASYACVTEQPTADQATSSNDEPYVTTPTQEEPEVQVQTSIVGTWTTIIDLQTEDAIPTEITWTVDSDGRAEAAYFRVLFVNEGGTERHDGGVVIFAWEQSDKVTSEGYMMYRLTYVTSVSGGFYAHLLGQHIHYPMDEIYLWINEDTGKLHDGFMEFMKEQ